MGGSKLSLLSRYVKLSCYECESSPVTPGTAQSRQYRDADWRQIGTFFWGKYSLHSLILSILQPKKPKQAPQPPPPQVVWLLLRGFIPAQSQTTPWKWKSGSCLRPQQGQGLAAGASVRFVEQDIKITASISRCPGFPSAAVPFSTSCYTIAQLDRKSVLFLLPLLSLKPGRGGMAGAKPCWLSVAGFPPALHPGHA